MLLGFLRLSTHPAIFPRPLDLDSAIGSIDRCLSLDITLVIREKDEHWNISQQVLKETGVAGNLATDGHLAALAISHGAVLVSCDSDFSRFKGLRWENPVA